MRLVYGIIALLLVLAVVMGCTLDKQTDVTEDNDLDLEGIEDLDATLDTDLDTSGLDQLIDDLDSY